MTTDIIEEVTTPTHSAPTRYEIFAGNKRIAVCHDWSSAHQTFLHTHTTHTNVCAALNDVFIWGVTPRDHFANTYTGRVRISFQASVVAGNVLKKSACPTYYDPNMFTITESVVITDIPEGLLLAEQLVIQRLADRINACDIFEK